MSTIAMCVIAVDARRHASALPQAESPPHHRAVFPAPHPPSLSPADAGDDDRIGRRMRVPGRAAPGSKVTLPLDVRPGSRAGKSGSTRTAPVNRSAGPVVDGWEPARWITSSVVWAKDEAAKRSEAIVMASSLIFILSLPGALRSAGVLLVADLLHPVDGLAVERFLDGDVRHRRGRRRAVPVLLAGREPDHVAGRISSTGPPQRCARPQPAVTIRVWPSGCVCQPCARPART